MIVHRNSIPSLARALTLLLFMQAVGLGLVGCETPKGGGGKSGGGPVEAPAAKPRGPRERPPSGVDDVPAERSPAGQAPTARDSSGSAEGSKSGRVSQGNREAARNSRGRVGLSSDAENGIPTPRRQEGAGTNWSIVLGTFTGPDHAQAAEQSRERLAERIPEFRACTVRSTPRGSTILWGRYAGPEDPAARNELKRLHAYEWQGARPFAKAFLTRLESTRKPPTSPLDLRQLRVVNPNIDQLQTLQVAVWVDYDGTLPLETIRASAEGYAAQLRSRGHEAWFHHDDDLKMSVVTIGAFGADAYDSKSTLYHPDVEALLKKFPVMLVNGEPLSIRADAKNKRSPVVVQKPILVLVPPL